LKPESTREDIALQLWLADREFIINVHNRLRLTRLTVFEYAAHENGRTDAARSASGATTDSTPDKAAIGMLTIALDEWFAVNHRGSETTRIEVYPLRGEYWFLIRHGDVFIRAPKVRQQTTEILHYRPERDDVVVYSPALDEIRVNARTQGERELYIQQFGLHLRGSLDYFSHRAPYTLEPLRTQGAGALDADGLQGIANLTLREL